jgi:hypothetical protein
LRQTIAQARCYNKASGGLKVGRHRRNCGPHRRARGDWAETSYRGPEASARALPTSRAKMRGNDPEIRFQMVVYRDRDRSGEISRKRRILAKLTRSFAAILLSVTSATAVLAAGPSAAGTHGSGRVHRGPGTPLFNQAPSMPAPVLNPSTPYTAPATPEVPVSPASPGSVFGNGSTGR